MATAIRMKRIGRKNRPFFRVVVMDSRNRRDGTAIEEIGWYDPIREENNYLLKEDRVLEWLQKGAQPSLAVKKLMKKSGISFRLHLMKQGLDEKQLSHEVQKWELDRQEREKKLAKKTTEAKVEIAEEEKIEEPVTVSESEGESVEEVTEQVKLQETTDEEQETKVASEEKPAESAEDKVEIETEEAVAETEIEAETEVEVETDAGDNEENSKDSESQEESDEDSKE